MSPYIRIDDDSLRRFSRVLERDLNERMRPRARECTGAIDEGEGALGLDARFTEAAAVRANGVMTTSSAHSFVDELVRHVDAITLEVRRARRDYTTMDQEAADRISEHRGRVWLEGTRALGTDGHLFGEAYRQNQADVVRGKIAPR